MGCSRTDTKDLRPAECLTYLIAMHLLWSHFLMITFWDSEEAIRAFAGDDISVAKYYDFDQDFLLELEPCSTHYEMYDR
jgi:hypothetical protein